MLDAPLCELRRQRCPCERGEKQKIQLITPCLIASSQISLLPSKANKSNRLTSECFSQ